MPAKHDIADPKKWPRFSGQRVKGACEAEISRKFPLHFEKRAKKKPLNNGFEGMYVGATAKFRAARKKKK